MSGFRPRAARLVAASVALLGVAAAAHADPSWSSASALLFGRGLHAATTLSDGTVLVTGGRGCPGELLSASFGAERYDPTLDRWLPTAPMNVPRDRHAAIRLADGRVLVAGGQVTAGLCPARVHLPRSSTEVYDPAANRWSAVGNLRRARSNFTLSLLPDGRVLAAGGGPDAATEVYDPTTGTWDITAEMTRTRSSHTATVLTDGRVLVVGGFSDTGVTAGAEVFDSATGTWTDVADMPLGVGLHQAALLPNGRVLVAGGIDAADLITGASALFDPATGEWTSAAPMSTRRAFFTLTPLADGEVLAAGGSSELGGAPLASSEVFDPATAAWTPLPDMPSWHTSHAATRLADGSVLVVSGGYEDFGFNPAVDRFVR